MKKSGECAKKEWREISWRQSCERYGFEGFVKRLRFARIAVYGLYLLFVVMVVFAGVMLGRDFVIGVLGESVLTVLCLGCVIWKNRVYCKQWGVNFLEFGNLICSVSVLVFLTALDPMSFSPLYSLLFFLSLGWVLANNVQIMHFWRRMSNEKK
ncbi:MAG: hypothetical protein FWD76_01095 [Firmicutes bacterium]|nr:hypothetical protein [Bacillota bacterium]